MKTTEWQEKVEKAGNGLVGILKETREKLRENRRKELDQSYIDGANDQRDDDIKSAIRAFLYLKKSDEEIINCTVKSFTLRS